MMYLCEVTSVADPLGIDRVKGVLIAEPDLGETDWIFRGVQHHPDIDIVKPAIRAGELVWVSPVYGERNSYVWVHRVKPEHASATLNAYKDILDTYT